MRRRSPCSRRSRASRPSGAWSSTCRSTASRSRSFPPAASASGNCARYLDALESTGFAADLLLVDYAGLMQTDADNYRISLGRVYEELLGLAHARNIAVCTAQQVNREGAKAARVDMTHISEDWSIAGTADMVLAFTRSEEEQRHKLGWLWVNKNRSGRMNYGLMLAQNYEHGQFALDSCGMERAAYLALLEQLGGERQQPRRTAGWHGRGGGIIFKKRNFTRWKTPSGREASRNIPRRESQVAVL